MARITLLLALHNHQPDGNFDEVFAQAYEDCYQRIVQALVEAPHVRCALHHTGALLEWIERRHPDYLEQVRTMVRRGQVEILGGGFYEPMLAVLPERDALGQIAMMGDWCEQRFGMRPTGMWLAERVWEPGLPQLLAQAGIRYTLIDDNHFRAAGMSGPLRGYYSTEKAGSPLAIFPIEQKLRYAIPFATPEGTIAALEELSRETPDRECVVTYGDDGEKFGVWPGTKEWVWDKGWLKQFFALLGQYRETIRTAHLAEVLTTHRPSGRVYLPTASYEEMGEWALPAKAQHHYHKVRHGLEVREELEHARPYLRGGIWQGFLAKYPEANLMHKKMVQVSDRVAQAVAAHPERENENLQMRTELYRAQCNCSYWHGLFGGLYLNYLRDTVYRHLLVAEAFADAQLGRAAPAWAPNADPAAASQVHIEERDVDADLTPEIVIQSATFDVLVRAQEGGVVEELSYRPKTFMLTNVLGRHEEGYHEKLRQVAAAEKAAAEADVAAQRVAAELSVEPRKTESGAPLNPTSVDAGQPPSEPAERKEQPKSIHDLIKVKEPGLEKHLIYDHYPRRAFIDHFLGDAATLDQFATNTAEELGDFVGAGYEWRREASGDGSLLLVRVGRVRERPVRLEKRLTLLGNSLRVDYELTLADAAQGPLAVRFAPELSLSLLDGHSPERIYQVLDRTLAPGEQEMASRGVLENVPGLSLANLANRFRVDLRFGDARPTIWRFPLETVSMSEAGFERTYQGSVILPIFPIQLSADRPARVRVEVALVDL
ncbi:MAG TPA: alpha-amylase/4-alpha-glucanotransferase domain-containing protein [Polyangia bacterium]|jgi:alpha-amylase|nr:alpha-amylase/4-alpha-glucanotransferase domain-containing protein [Polyangia bacterium]